MASQRNMSISLSPLNKGGIFPNFMPILGWKNELPDNRSHLQYKIAGSSTTLPCVKKKRRKNSLHGILKNTKKTPQRSPCEFPIKFSEMKEKEEMRTTNHAR